MYEVLYAFYILGGFSLGYSLLRAGFPSAQGKKGLFKLGAGFGLGAAVFGLPAALSLLGVFDGAYFFGAALGLYALLFLVFFARRVLAKQTDQRIQKAKNKRLAIPHRVLTEEEKYRRGISEPKKMDFEQGLMVKSRQYAIKPSDIKKQVFKEKDNNILKAIDKKTKEIESGERESQKNEALAKLKELAKGIDKKKKTELEKADEMENIEEDLLNNIGGE